MKNLISNPKISIIIPVYNTPENLLRDCLESAKNQTLEDIEIICVDDGSTNGSEKILDEYAKNDPRFKVIHQENGGLSVARNRGMELAKGEYIKFLDSDDMIYKTAAEKSYDMAKKYDADMVRYSCQDVEKGKTEKWLGNYDKFEVINDPSYDILKIFIYKRVLTAWGGLYKNKFLKDNNLKFCESIKSWFEDNFFNVLCSVAASKFVFMPDKLYIYRNNDQSIMGEIIQNENMKNVFNKQQDSLIKGIKYLLDYWKKSGYLNEINMKMDALKSILVSTNDLISCFSGNQDFVKLLMNSLFLRYVGM